jgi:LmbE family N-acetylglucosaminyl deacetylase
VVVVTWTGPALLGERLVVVAPHPDDEVLAAGGLMRWTADQGRDVVIVAVTDGEASHARSTRIGRDELRTRRADERAEALDRLGVGGAAIHRLGAPDQGCAEHVAALAQAIGDLLGPGDVVVGPSGRDRHPDHVATAAAVRAATGRCGDAFTVVEAPTWALVHGTADPPTSSWRLDDPAWAAKRHAVAAYRSQLEALGPEEADGPVVHPHELDVMLTRTEQFVAASR